jgi:ABC-type transport system involved in multi-copper enzyme maturation permease subunit
VSVPTAGAALGSLARVTWKRTLRRKTLWVAAAIAFLPCIYAMSVHHSLISSADDVFNVAKVLLAILPPVFVAASIGEEIEDRTATYLWSRPLGRWTVVIGKLLALAPIVIGFVCASWLLPAAGILHVPSDLLVTSSLALAAGAVTASMASAGLACLIPRQGMSLTIVYVLADLMIGAMPISINKLSFTYHVGALVSRQLDTHDKIESAIGLTVIACLWLVAGLRRIRRLEV